MCNPIASAISRGVKLKPARLYEPRSRMAAAGASISSIVARIASGMYIIGSRVSVARRRCSDLSFQRGMEDLHGVVGGAAARLRSSS